MEEQGWFVTLGGRTMNKIYKSIWNHVTRTFTAVSEAHKNNGKRSKNSLFLNSCLAALLTIVPAMSFAYDVDRPVTGNNEGFYIGSNDPFQIDKDSTNIPSGTEFQIHQLHDARLDSDQLIAMSSKAYEQVVLSTNNIGINSGLKEGALITGNWTQGQKNDTGDTVATLKFALGSEAYQLMDNNRTSYKSDTVEFTKDGWLGLSGKPVIRVEDGIYGEKNYYETGFAWESSDLNDDGSYLIWTLAVLKEAELLEGKTLVLDGIVDNDNIWSAKITGNGSIKYSGSGELDIKTTLSNGFDDTNTYSGETHIVGDGGRLTVNLSKKNSFGETSFLNAENANINVQNSEAWTSVKNLSLNSVQTDFSSSGTNLFTVQNSGQTAVFKGNNEFVLPENFFYAVNGNAEIADGTTTFSGTDSTVQIDGTLTLHSAKSLALTDGTLKIGTSLDFADVEESSGVYTQKTDSTDEDGYIVNLTNSTIQYVDGSSLTNVSQTTLNENSSLTLSASNQSYLGGTVVFGEGERSQLTINSSGELNLTDISLIGSDGLTILHAGVPGEMAQSVTLADSVDLSQYGGWLRIESGALSLNSSVASKFNSEDPNDKSVAGLSVGEGGVVRVTGSETLSLNRFGWAVVDGEGHRDGALDLRGFEFTDQNKAALIIENIQLDSNGDNFVIVDTDEVLNGLTMDTQSGSVFALDDGNVGQLLIQTTLTQGESSGAVTLVDENYQEITSGSEKQQNFYSFNDSDKTLAAVGHWDVTVGYRAEDQAAGVNQSGIYVQYALSGLTLVNGGTLDAIDSSQPLNSKAALVAVSNESSRRLSTKIDGYGVLEVKDGHGAGADRFVEINNTENSYEGATVVRDNTELRFVHGALGGSSVVLSGENADLTFQSSTSEGQITPSTQTINGLHTDAQTHQITLNEKTTLHVAGNGEKWEDPESYLAEGNPGNVLGENTVLSGTGSLVFENGVVINVGSAAAFNDFKGTIAQKGSSTIHVDGLETLSGGKYLGEQASTIVLKTSAQIGSGQADFSGYDGTIRLSGVRATYTIAAEDVTKALSKDSTLDAQNVLVKLNGVKGGFDNRVTGSGSVLRLENSSVELDAETGEKKGFASVEINENSALVLKNGESEGALDRFAENTAFGGSGKLALSNYELTDTNIDLSKLSGMLALKDASTFTLNASAGYAVELSGESTLVVSGTADALAVGQSDGTLAYKDLTVQGQGTLDLTGAQASQDDGALFTVNQVVASDENSLTVKVSESQTKMDAESKNILDQDEGWDRLLVESVAENADAAQATIVDQNGKEVAAEAAEIALGEGVTGTYAIGSSGQNGDIGLTYRLNKLNIGEGASFELVAKAASDTDARDLGVVLTGSGELDINGNVIVANQKGSTFSGVYALQSSSDELMLSGAASAATVKFAQGSSLVVASDQILSLDAEQTSANIRFASDGLTLTLKDKSTLGAGSVVIGSTNDRVVLDSNTSAALAVGDGAAGLLNGFDGLWQLGSDTTLSLKESGDAQGTLDRVIVAKGATVDLQDGTYTLTNKHQTVDGKVTVNQAAELLLSGENAVFNTGETAELSGEGTVALAGSSTVEVGADNVAGFAGFWDLTQTGSTLRVQAGANGLLNSASSISLADDSTLELANAGKDAAIFNAAVNQVGSETGIFKISQGNVEIAEGSIVRVARTQVSGGDEGAQLLVHSLDQLGSQVKIDGSKDSVFIQTAGDLTFDKTVGGSGTLRLDLKKDDGTSGALVFAQDSGAVDNNILVWLANAVYQYDKNAGFNRYVVGSGGTFKVGSDKANLETIGWRTMTEQSGVIDLTEYAFDTSTGPAIDADYIEFSSDGNIVKIDSTDFALTGQALSGNILTLDSANPNRLLIAGKKTDDDETAAITLVDEKGHVIGENGKNESTYIDDGSGRRKAKLDWSVGASYQSVDDESGIYLDYSVQTITLLNGSTADTPENGTLDVDFALQAIGHAAASAADNALDSKITGHGIFEIGYEGTREAGNYVTLSNSGNDFTGATVVTENTTLVATGSALGGSTLVLIGDNADFRILENQNESRVIHGLTTDADKHTISIVEDRELILAEGTLSQDDLTALSEGYKSELTQNNELGKGTVLAGTGTLRLQSDLKVLSANAFNTFAGTVSLEAGDVTLTIAGDEKLVAGTFKSTDTGTDSVIALNVDAVIGSGESLAGVDFSDFSGMIDLSAGKTYDVYALDKLGEATLNIVPEVDSAAVVNMHKAEGGFDNAVIGSGGIWNLIGSNITLTEESGLKTGFDQVSVDEDSTLTLHADAGAGSAAFGGLGRFGVTDGKVDAAFAGSGRLQLEGYDIASDSLNLSNLTGTLGLKNARYTLSGMAGYDIDLADSTLVAAGASVALGDLTFSGGSGFDLTQAELDQATGALLTANSYKSDSEGTLTVKVKQDQIKNVSDNLSTHLLDQDESAGADWIFAKGDASNLGGLVAITDENGNVLGQSVDVELAQNVTGQYAIAGTTTKDGFGLNYRLTALEVGQAAQGFILDASGSASKDLKVKLTGSGNIGVDGEVAVAYQGQSDFSGTYALEAGSSLTLSGLNGASSGASVRFSKDSALTVHDLQTLNVGVVGSSGTVNLADDGRLLLTGMNTLEAGSAVNSTEDGRLGVAENAHLLIKNAADTLAGFAGGIYLFASGMDEGLPALELDGSDVAKELALDNIFSTSDSDPVVELAGGNYSLSGAQTNFIGTWNVGQSTRFTFKGWTQDRDDFGNAGARLTGSGTVALTNSEVLVEAANVSGFAGGFELGEGSSLIVSGDALNGFLNRDATVSAASDAESSLKLNGTITDTLQFGNMVDMASGSFEVGSGNVAIAEGASINVKETVIGQGAVLDAKYEQIGTSSVTVASGGLLNVAASVGEDKQFDFTQQITGKGTLNVDLGSTDNKLVFADGKNKESLTTVMVSNGTHVYDADDGFANYAVGTGGVFVVDSIVGSKDAPLGSFSWNAQGGQLDLSGITYTGEPALTVDKVNVLADGTLKLDLEKWVQDLEQSVDTNSNLLDADEGVEGNDILVVKGEVKLDGTVSLVDKNGDEVTADATTTEVDGGLALAHWGYELVKKNSESEKGLALTYALTKLELANSGADQNAVVLSPNEGGDNRFTAEITGSGKLEIQGDVELAHSGNTFNGQVAVTDKSTLTTQGSDVLGQGGVTLILGAEEGGANYIMAESQTTDGSVYSEKITLLSKGQSNVTLNGNRLEMLDGSTISDETAFSAGTDQKKTSSLIVAGDVTLESAASTLNATDAKDNLDGLMLEIAQAGNLIAKGDAFTLERVTGQGNVTLALDESAAATAGDLSGFGGTVSVGQKQNLVLNSASKVEGVTVALNEGKLSVQAAQSVGALTTTAGSQIDFGSMSVGAEAADGVLTIKGTGANIADSTVFSLDIDTNVTDHQSVLALDDGMTTKLLAAEDGGLDQKSFDLSVQGLENGAMTGILKDGDKQIGTLHFAVAQETTATEVGIKSTLESIDLTGELKLAANGADLKAQIDGTKGSVVSVNGSGTLTLAGKNTYDALNVADSAAVDLTAVQTIVGKGGVVAGALTDDNEQSLILDEGADLTFTAAQNGLKHGVGFENGSQLILSGINAEGDSLLAGPLTLLSGEASLAAKNSKGMLDLEQIEVGAGNKFLVAAENSALALKDGQVDLTDKIGVSLENSSLAMTSSEQTLAVDWSNLSGDDKSVVSIASTADGKAELSFGNVADGFKGTVEIRNYAFAFGGSNTGNNALLASHNTSFADSDLHANGKSTVGNLKLDNGSTLSFHESERIDLGDSSTSLITVAEGGNLNLGGANVRIDTDNLNFEFTDSQSGTTSESLLTALNKAQADDVKYFKLVDGKVENVGSLTDLNGQDLSESSSVGVLGDDGRTVAELGFGANLQIGEGGEDLWVGQGLRTLKLHESMTLNAQLADGLTLTDGVFNINAVVTSANDSIDLTIEGETPIQLNGANGWISGSTSVFGHLILGASYALGGSSDGSKPTTGAINVEGTLTLKDNVAQSTQQLAVAENGLLELGSNARVEVIGSEAVIAGAVEGEADSSIVFKEDAVVKVEEGADLNGMKGQWDLTSGAVMKIAAGEQGQSLTSGSILGGTLVKTGEGELELGFGVVNNNDVAIESQDGSLKVTGWTDTLSVKSMTLKDSEFALAGNLKTAEGFRAESSTIWIGSRDHQAGEAFADRVIEGDFAAVNATLVFNTALGTEVSDGDSLTITGDAQGKVTLRVHNTTDVKTDYQDLTILSVNGSVEEFEATANFDAEGYTYRLGTSTDEAGTDYFLTSKVDGGDSGSDGESMISARLGSLTGFASSFDMFAMSIHDRQGTRPWINPVTGEKTTTSLWMRQTASLENTKESHGQLDSRNNEYVTMLGGDILQHSASDNGYVFVGLMAGYGTSDVRTASSLSGNKGRTDTDGWMVGAYGGWHQNNPNTNRTGLYAAGWVQYSHFKTDITQSGDPMSVSAQGLSASLEAGWVAKAADFLMDDGVTHGALYIEPHAQVTWSGVESENLSDRNMDIYGKHNITTRLGARVTLETNGATNFSPYLEANWVYNTKDYGARWGEVESYQEGAGSQAEVKLGAETFFTDAFSGYAQLRLNWGGDGYSRKEGSLGLKYRF